MDDQGPVVSGDEEWRAPAGEPEWSYPSPWMVPEPPVPVPVGPPPPPPGAQGPNRLTAALVLALVLAMATAAWAVIDRWDISFSKPTISEAPAPRPSADGARPGGRSNGRPFRQAPSGSAPDIDVNAVAAKVQPALVDIYTQLSSGLSGAGTGVILSPDGTILTNNHVIEGSTSISVEHVATGRRYTAVVVGVVPSEDIAVLQLQEATLLPTVPLGKSSSVEVGDPIVALGNAGGVGGAPHTVSGTVQALNQTITATDLDGNHPETLTGLIQIDAPLEPGDSGGPLINKSGQVIGINTAASATRRFRAVGDAVGFAIPMDRAMSLANQILAGQASATVLLGYPGQLGVVMSEPALATVPGGGAQGVTVAEVMAGSPAASAGVKAGDVLTEVDGQAATAPDQVSGLIKKHRAGEKLNFTWIDDTGRRRTSTVVLAPGPAD